MKPRKTAYDKIMGLLQLSPNSATLKTALRHFGDDALLRELQRRNAMPALTEKEGSNGKTPTLAHFGDSELIDECLDRDMLVIDTRELKRAIDAKDWDAILELYWRN